MFLAGWLAASSAWSENSLTIEQCISAGREHNIAAQQALLRMRAADAAKGALGADRKPQVQFSGGADYAPGTKRFGYDPAVSDLGHLRSQVIIEQILYDGGRLKTQTDRAGLDVSAYATEQSISVADVDLAIRDAFIQGLRARQEEKLRRDAYEDLTLYLQTVSALHASGTVSSSDLIRTKVERSVALTAMMQARQKLSESRLSLAALMGSPSDTDFVLEGDLADPSLQGPPITDRTIAFDSAASLDLAAADIAWKQALTDVREAKTESRPTISLLADAGYLTSRDNLIQPSSDRYRGVGVSIGASFDVPLFDWGRRRLTVQQKTLEAEAARLQISQLHRTLSAQHETALVKLAQVQVQLDTIRGSISGAQDNFVLTKAAYTGGGATASEVLSARQLVTDLKLSELDALTEIQSVRAVLTRLRAQ